MTSAARQEFVIDSSVLFHFTIADRLDTLGSLIPAGSSGVTTRAVDEEISAKIDEYPLATILKSAEWLRRVPVDGLDDLWTLSRWVRRMGSDQHHRGEATVLAYAEAHGAVAILDDKEARRLGATAGLDVHGSLWLIAQACRAGRLPIAAAAGLIDTVASTGARFPCNGSSFVSWAAQNGLILDPPRPETRVSSRAYRARG